MTRDPLMPEVLDGFDRALRRKPVRRRWFATRAFGITLVGLAVGGTALAAVAPWNPMGHGSDAATTTPPPRDQLHTLAVLNRAQTEDDRGPLITAILAREGEMPHAGKVRLPFVRHLRDGESRIGMVMAGSAEPGSLGTVALYLVPRTTKKTPYDGNVGPLQFCLTSVYDFWPDPATTPGDLRQIAKRTKEPVPERPPNLGDRVSGGETCASAHVVRMKGLSSGGAANGNIFGLVPDGVAAVRARTRDGQLVEAPVEQNSFQLLAPGWKLPPDPHDRDDRPWTPPMSGQFKSGTFEWLDASGQVIRRMPY